jgi:resuscitation-promoting factor RpfB
VRHEQPPAAPRTAYRAVPARLGSWWGRLEFTPKIAAITAGLLLLCWGGFGLVSLFTGSPTSSAGAPSGDVASYSELTPEAAAISPAPATGPATTTTGPAATTTGPVAPTTGPAAPTTAALATQPPEPVVEKRIVTETQTIAYDTETVRDNTLEKGTSAVRTDGVPGVRTLTYEVTLTDGVQTAKRLVRSVVTTDPVTEVIAIGTKPTPRCDPNYEGACVPIASDVDCTGSGDGPEYVDGPVQVIGDDIYDLDPDGDGVGCDA